MHKIKEATKKYLAEIKEIKPINFIFLLAAGIINAFGVTLFLFPVKLYDSGVSGLSMLLDQVTPAYLNISLFLIVINFPIFIFGTKKQGINFTLYSLFTIGIYSLFSYLIMNVFPIDVSLVSPLAGEDLLLCAIFGGVISGVGSGLTIRFGGAIDGIDVLSVVFAKKIGISIGTFVMIFNLVLYIICGIVIGSFILPLYSIVTYFVGSKTVDFITDGFDRSKCAMIVTSKASEITDALKENFGSSGTIVNAVGGYTKENKQIVYFILNRFQMNKLKEIIREIDEKAFISFEEVSEISRNVEI
ncbi:MAG: YitT family protein [Bacilli bacterium]|nr:YitT family protein [Bacilli bacterium]MDY5745598.1 YitT family protein [Bacilli bacterium]